jgi:hypothetical protein
MRHSTESNLKIEYLGKYEFIFKKALAQEGTQGYCLPKKTGGRKSRESVPLISALPTFVILS